MAKTRAQREAEFRAARGVSSGTYYAMRRKAEARGISPKTFDKVAVRSGYGTAKRSTQEAATNLDQGRHTAAIGAGLIPKDVAFADFYDAIFDADIPDDYDWWYH